MTWDVVKKWDEAAFVSNALPELTSALGLYLVLSDLDEFEHLGTDIAVIDPVEVARLREGWLARSLASFPKAWHPAFKSRVASAENFRLALVAHLDQVPFKIKAPTWIKVARALAVILALGTVLAVAAVIAGVYGPAYTHTLVVMSEAMPLVAAALALAATVGRERFRSQRAAAVSNCVRQELRGAITHAFARPISQVAAEMNLLKELSFD